MLPYLSILVALLFDWLESMLTSNVLHISFHPTMRCTNFQVLWPPIGCSLISSNDALLMAIKLLQVSAWVFASLVLRVVPLELHRQLNDSITHHLGKWHPSMPPTWHPFHKIITCIQTNCRRNPWSGSTSAMLVIWLVYSLQEYHIFVKASKLEIFWVGIFPNLLQNEPAFTQ